MNEKISSRFLSAILFTVIAGFLAVILMSTRLHGVSLENKELSAQILNRLIVPDENPCLMDSSGILTVSYETAKGYIQNYLDSRPVVTSEVIRGYSLNSVQYRAVNNMIQKDQLVSGVRLYIGLNERAQEVIVIVGTDREGRDIATYAYVTEKGSAGLCPPICD
jgi:hypothetical protein